MNTNAARAADAAIDAAWDANDAYFIARAARPAYAATFEAAIDAADAAYEAAIDAADAARVAAIAAAYDAADAAYDAAYAAYDAAVDAGKAQLRVTLGELEDAAFASGSGEST